MKKEKRMGHEKGSVGKGEMQEYAAIMLWLAGEAKQDLRT